MNYCRVIWRLSVTRTPAFQEAYVHQSRVGDLCRKIMADCHAQRFYVSDPNGDLVLQAAHVERIKS